MKAMLAAFAAIAVIAVGANLVLTRTLDYSTVDVTASDSVRLD